MNLELKWDGFHLTSHLEDIIRSQLAKLLEAAPYDSRIASQLKRVKDGYEGVLHVISSEGRFVAKALSHNLGDLATNLSSQIHHQIRQWHGHRFLT